MGYEACQGRAPQKDEQAKGGRKPLTVQVWQLVRLEWQRLEWVIKLEKEILVGSWKVLRSFKER